ncbi:glycosyltransferase family 2 protein [Agromyces sp. Marseille-Q5079]|uniref:glycosyltransferase family 2 protein n=1 Tax=Agromyces sp. Marseille-Q5079 TaxID=3439059 RepID=UPI003D9CBA09
MGEAVSVVMPTYNRRQVLPRAIDSVLGQTVPVAELIVVDDGSTDGSIDYLRERAVLDSRIQIVETAHSGAAVARNHGIDLARGEYIAFQDSDDEWAPEFIERLLPHVTGRSDVVAFASHRVRHRDGSDAVVPGKQIRRPERELLFRSIASTQTLLIPAALLRARPFDARLRRFQDWDLCLSILEREGTEFVHEPTVAATLYRLDDSISEGSPAVRSASLRRILKQHRSLFLRHPFALARIVARAYLRPSAGPRGAVGSRVSPTSSSGARIT